MLTDLIFYHSYTVSKIRKPIIILSTCGDIVYLCLLMNTYGHIKWDTTLQKKEAILQQITSPDCHSLQLAHKDSDFLYLKPTLSISKA